MLAAVASGWVVVAVAIVVAPQGMRVLAAKEGACELVSHGVLALAVIAWSAAAVAMRRRRDGSRGWVAMLVAVAAAFVLAEELDWGGVLGLRGAADWLEARVGAANVHNAARGHSYALFALAGPVIAWIAIGRGAAARRWRTRLGAWAPVRGDGLAALLVVAVALASALLVPAWESEIDEIAELFGYAILAAIAGRGHASGLARST